MKLKLAFGAGFATGYYFGAKAGRARYEQIRQRLDQVKAHPRVQAVSERVGEAVDAQIDRAKEAVATTVKDKVESAKDKVESAVDTARHALPGNRGAAPDGSPHGTATIPPASNTYSSSR